MSEYITLYQVSFDTKRPLTRRYEPQVPVSTMLGEDKVTPRVCFASSVEGCITAIPGDRRRVHFGEDAVIAVFPLRVALDDPALITPDDLKDFVPDAEFTREYWYTEPVALTGHLMRVESFAWGNYFFATEADRVSVYKVLTEEYSIQKEELAKYDQIPAFDLVNFELNNNPEYWGIDNCLGDTVADMLDIPNNMLFDFVKLSPCQT